MMCRIDDQFMLGDRLLVAPVLKAGQRSRSVYLPTPLEGSGVWKRETDGTFFEGGQWLHNSRLGYPAQMNVHIY
jgi:alpha-glucosidase (family GH31 glycosyl hydrolase)